MPENICNISWKASRRLRKQQKQAILDSSLNMKWKREDNAHNATE